MRWIRTATNNCVPNLGDRVISGKNELGQGMHVRYAVANVTVALDSVSQICDAGASVTFGRHGGFITQQDGSTIPFQREGDTYTRIVWALPEAGGSQAVRNQETPFNRPDARHLQDRALQLRSAAAQEVACRATLQEEK